MVWPSGNLIEAIPLYMVISLKNQCCSAVSVLYITKQVFKVYISGLLGYSIIIAHWNSSLCSVITHEKHEYLFINNEIATTHSVGNIFLEFFNIHKMLINASTKPEDVESLL